jgi:hypothetical protein
MDRSKHIPEHGRAFKNALNIPVIIASQHDPVQVEKNIAEGMYDIQALGRQLFCDPEYVNKLSAGRPKDIVRCTRCNVCLMRTLIGLTPTCPNNRNLGREYTLAEYKIGVWQETEILLPHGLVRAPMPALERPWWKKDVGEVEKCWRPLRGGTPR